LVPEIHLGVEIFRNWIRFNRFIILDCVKH